ncbi:Ger(x)C family spore germination protein [Bacillus salitolerans]|uniref:Ger(X)C family spore germination protein n=1 Tax=Bacillus salitolerans TaxID=1437434 RepID=A0ABW4LZ78_9BACI
MWKSILISLVFVILLSGCAFKDIDKRLFVLGFGIDKSENDKEPYLISLRVSMPSSKGAGRAEEKYVVLQETGESISDAIQKIKNQVDKELDYGHTKIILLGSDIVPGRAGYISSWFSRQHDIQQITFVAVADGKAKDVFQTKPKTETQPSYELVIAFERTGTEDPHIITKYLFEYRREYYDDGVDPVLPVVKVKEKQYLVETAAIVDNEGNLLKLSREETQLVNVINSPKNQMYIKVKSKENFLSVRTDKNNIKITLQTDKEPLVIKMEMDIGGVVEESFEKISEDERKIAEEMLEEKLKEQVEDLLKKVQEEKVDPFGFGIRYRSMQWNDSNSAKRWEDIYPRVQFEVKTNVNIRSIGTLK